uniref:DUF1618 domain-containing protein n=1 Tax=Oryza brachyantha TaxID=4533 RepID=J3KY49_ORYBR
MAPPQPSPPPSWVMLRREVRACGGGVVLPEGDEVSVELAAPPRATVLTVSPRVSPPNKAGDWASVVALDPSAGLVVLASQWSDDYFVCDIAAGTATCVPNALDADYDVEGESLGLIAAAPGGGANSYMVVEFKPVFGDEEGEGTIIARFFPEFGRWMVQEVNNPLPYWPWRFDSVVSHDHKLWWVDTSKGIVFCDPFAVEVAMEYVPLDPEPDHNLNGRATHEQRRIVQLSNGMFRRVEISPASNGAAPELSMRTLVNPETAEWALEHAVSFADIWASESYKATGLPEKDPEQLNGAFVHPKNPDVVYFFLEKHLLGVDLRGRKLVEYEARVSSDTFLPWELPPALSAGNMIPRVSTFPLI